MNPIIKTETSEGPHGGQRRNIVKVSLWDPLQLGNLQEKYKWRAGETETEYLWGVCLTGGRHSIATWNRELWVPGCKCIFAPWTRIP